MVATPSKETENISIGIPFVLDWFQRKYKYNFEWNYFE
jgi:hypothetical protein